jgi:glycosyltransferase involved in cell wall biosynthesis
MAPDVIHLHHYMGFGTDLIRMFKKDLGLPVILTLHEYLAICHRDGQMLKTSDRLCYAASPAECSLCFPDRSSGRFFLRRALIMENFSYVDLFIAPSAFLAERYVDWGLDAERVRVIDNPVAVRSAEAGRRESDNQFNGRTAKKRFAYFGQFTPYKGLDVLVEAVASLDEGLREQVQVFLFGFQPNRSGTELQRRIAASIDALKGCIMPRGPYRHEDVVELMRSVDWVIVPSIWWENSPVVIQEAKMAGVPVLCSNIGGMREKVRPGIDGAHFRVSDSADLADKIRAICAGELVINVSPSAEEDTATEVLIDLYRMVHAGPRREYPSAGSSPLPRYSARPAGARE